MELQPDKINRQTTAAASSSSPESTFNFERERLEKFKWELERQDFYTRLGLRLGATPAEARKAMLAKTKEFHPDNKPDALKEIYGKIFALYTEASNILAEVKSPTPKQEKKPTPLEEFKKAFQMYRTLDTPLGKPASETFNILKTAYIKSGKITEEEASLLETSLLGKAA